MEQKSQSHTTATNTAFAPFNVGTEHALTYGCVTSHTTLKKGLVVKYFINSSAKNTIFALLSVVVLGCSSIEKADIPSTANPADEVAKLDTDIARGYEQHFDVLAFKDLKKSEKHLKEAKETLSNSRKYEDTFDNLRYSRAYFTRAEHLAQARRSSVEPILAARQKALT